MESSPSDQKHPLDASHKTSEDTRTCRSDFERMKHLMREQLSARSSWPLYVDTESYYVNLEHGSKLALVSIFNVTTRTVYLFRTHDFNSAELENFRNEFKKLVTKRETVTFGREEELKCATCDIRRHPQMSLQDTAARIGAPISKSKTMSNWTAWRLREDQIRYAMMDAIVLHYINLGSALNWSYVSSITCTNEDVDWTFNVAIVNVLERVNTELGLATGRRNKSVNEC
ncbi:hypothetical protein CRE_24937 [Caenorhabditis remanei]|uniref:3'-5' exonuclease domain-containing protein n=1 Tax=Caenorhabditis remanei TaxID=31234 RepID=E3MHV1_CAERE|nr:hypothetical protein CRE_24937 [Caenorhabditis remanei]